MKKALLTIVGVLLLSSWAYAQVIADFEKDAGSFVSAWGNNVTSVAKGVDPTGKSTGVLEVKVDFSLAGDKKAAFKKSKIDATKAKLIAYYIYIPANTPDSLLIKVWNQGPGWKWQDVKYYAKNLAKGAWFPIYFDFVERNIADANFNASTAPCEEGGLELYAAGLKGTDASWKGSILVDNVSLLGAEPSALGDFETNESGFGKGWGDGLLSATRIADPTTKSKGVLQLDVDASLGDKKAAIKKSKIDAQKATTVSYLVWLPKDTPDGIAVKVWMQGPGWNWNDIKFDTKNIKKEVWFPLHFDLPGIAAKNANFKYSTAVCEEGGLEFYFADLKAPASSWKGKILVDNASLFGTETGSKWIVCNFEATAAGTQGWTKWFGGATTDLTQGTFETKGVLKLAVDFSKAGIDNKAAISKGNVAISSKTPALTATFVTLDVYVPKEVPSGGQVGLIVNGAEGGWNEAPYQIVDTAKAVNHVEKGKWQTLTMDVTKLIADKKIADPTKNVTVGMQLYHAAAAGYKGNVYFDNLTVVGIPEPVGTIASPKTVAKVVTFTLPSTQTYDYVQLDWVDGSLSTATYNIYQSLTPITDLKAAGVVKIIQGIPYGMQSYITRPYTSDGATKDYYYAITAFDGVNETGITTDNKVGPLKVKTTKTYKVQYVKDFATKFSLDGLDTEFGPYKVNEIKPEAGTYASGVDKDKKWDSQSIDMNFKTTFVIDDKFLYISAVVDDDDLRQDKAQQAWEGDALEFYMGFYDVKILKEYHTKNLDAKKGDYRIGFNALGQSTRDGGAASTTDGVSSTVFQKFTGDGYVIEAKIELNKLAENGKFLLNNGMWMPLRIDGNDWDPNIGDTQRSLIVQVGGKPNDGTGRTDEGWKRPDDWGYMEVVGAPTVDVEESNLPTEFALSNNYPNPFNPATTIKYDLPKESQVTLKIYDILGREVATLVNTKQAAGYYQIRFDASRLATGVYVYRIIAGDFVQTKKMMLVK